MQDRIELFLNCHEELQKKIKIFIEYFVKYYGEENREQVESALSKAMYIGYMTPKTRSRLVYKYKGEASKMFQDVVVERTTLPLDFNDIFNDYSFETINLLPINNLMKLKELHEKGKKQRLKEFIDEGYEFAKKYLKDISKLKFLSLKSTDQLDKKLPSIIDNNLNYYFDKSNAEEEYQRLYEKCLPLLQKINPNITISSLDTIFKNEEVNDLLNSYFEALQQYQLFLNENKEHINADENFQKLERVLKEKYYLLYLKENISLIPEEHRTPIYKYINGESKNLFANSYISAVLGATLVASSTYIEYFSTEQEEKLNNPDVDDWTKNSIKRQRINYFNGIGIDLGDNYEDYLNNPECQKNWPNDQTIKRIVESRTKYQNKFNNELFASVGEFKQIRDEIDSLGLLDKNDSFNATLLTESSTFINPNIRYTDQGIDVFSLFVINFDSIDSDTMDHHIVHELNHLYELVLTEIRSKEYEMLVGWDISTGTIDDERVKEVETINIVKKKRNYELFNEIINELIAQDICEMMHNDNVHVFDEPNNSRYKYTTSYEDYAVIVRDFFKEFKEQIIASRKNGNIQAIFDTVGEENFEELNLLIKYFYENFSGFKIYSLRGALKKNEDNEMTRIYYEIIEKRDQILENMRNYSNEKKTSHTL